MEIISIGQIIELNAKLEPLGCRVHLSDACGGQSMWLEALAGGDPSEPAFAQVDAYFAARGLRLQYSRGRTSFHVAE